MISIELNNQTKDRIPQKFIKDVIKNTLKELKIKKARISVALVDRKTIRQLNKIYRGKDKVTDVLSFCFKNSRRDVFEKDFLGEIIICSSQAQKQAKEYNYSLKEEIKVLVIHGLLHLLGYNHQEMKKILSSFN